MDIQLHRRTEIDSEFFFTLFGEIKIAELHAGRWPEPMKNQLISMQYHAYEHTMKNDYPDADDFVVLVNSVKAGRLQLYSNSSGIRIINISLLPAFQKNGVGSRIIKDILAEAELQKKPVYLEVDKVNPALNLYERLGFKINDQNELKYSMKYCPLI